MKKILIGLLCICILLSGCGGNAPQPTQTAATTAPSPTTEPAQPLLPLLEQGIALEESRNLLYIPNDTVESMRSPEVWLYGNGLLLGAYIKDRYVLRHISLADGSLLAECEISASPGVKVRIGNGCIGVLDSGTNRFILLKDDLTVESTRSISVEGDAWCMSSQLDILYRFYYDRGVLAQNLRTGEEYWLVEHGVFTRILGAETEYVLFEYTDAQDQRTYVRCLNLSTGMMETLPCSVPVSAGTRRGETWLLGKDGEEGTYILADTDRTASFTWNESEVTLLTPRKHLLVTDFSGRTLRLYDNRGRFVSTAALPDAAYSTVGTDMIWSGYWGGYFFTDTIEDTCRLMYWDVEEPTEGEDLELIPMEQPQQIQPVLEKSLYDRAEAISARFGVNVLIAEQCSTDHSHYQAHQLMDSGYIRSALNVLEACLERYPEGFFRQLPHGPFERIQIELVGGLLLKDEAENQPESTAAFVQDQEDHINVVIDGLIISHSTVFHEFSHVIDRRLSWDAQIRADALYSEERWLALQPEGFAYAMSYTDLPEELLPYMDTGYFISDYAMRYPTEDRATLFAEAMLQSPTLEAHDGLRAKLDYYARCIRDCFNTEGWPEVAQWELPLQ